MKDQRVKEEGIKAAGKCNQFIRDIYIYIYISRPPFKVSWERVGLYTKPRRILMEGNFVLSLSIWDH